MSMLGKHHSVESKRKMPEAHKGQIPWMKGKRGIFHHTEEHKDKMRLRMLGELNPFYGKTHNQEVLSKIKLFKRGDISPRKGAILSEEQKERIASKLRGKTQPRELTRKRLARRSMSSLERKMLQIIEENNLPYKFVGDGKFFIEHLCPDFINCNGEKIAIEVFYRKHKQMFRGDLEHWKIRREAIFSKYGWRLLFFNETEVNEKLVSILQ